MVRTLHSLLLFCFLLTPALADEPVCLTGNAPPDKAARNVQIEGRYTYYDGGTFSYMFPRALVPTKTEKGTYDEPGRNGGWMAFREGKLTDGKTETEIGWPQYWISNRSIEVYFDLGQEYLIDSVEVASTGGGTIRNTWLWLQSPDEKRETMVRNVTDRPTFATTYYPKLESPYVHKDLNNSARWVRVGGCWKGAAYPGWSEIRIWGRPMPTGQTRPVKVAVTQKEGKFVVAEPKALALEQIPTRAIFPIPQELKLAPAPGNGAFVLSPEVKIHIAPDASERTATTARVLSEDIKELTKLDLKVVREVPGAKGSAIVIGPSKEKLPVQGYALRVEPQLVTIEGGDDQGTFYATQSLVQLVGLTPGSNSAKQWDIPACSIRDWPVKPMRYVSGGQMPTQSLIRALGRYKINYYDQPEGPTTKMAIENRQFAEDRFVRIVPVVGFESAWSNNPEELIERAPGEKLETMGVGRRSPCPSHPQVWIDYFARLDNVIACNGDYVRIGMDEMYQPANGARWNVCERCRARKLTGHELMADAIRKIHDYLASKGKKVCIIDSPFAFKGISNPDDNENDWRKIVPMLPNDMMVYVWHPKEVLEPLHKAGYPLLKWAVSAFKEPISDEYQGQYLNLHDGPFYVEQLMAMSQLCWSPGKALPTSSTCTAYLESALPRFREIWTGDRIPSRQPGAEFFTVDLKAQMNTTLVDDVPGDGKGFADLGGNYDLRALVTGKQTLAGVPFDITTHAVTVHNRMIMNKSQPSRVEIPFDKKAASLLFLHTLDDRPGQNYMIRKELCGYYFMVYEDGKYDKLEIKYNINIANFDGILTWWDYSPRSESLKRATLAWKGQTGAGQDAALYCTEWINPRPNAKISKIILASTHMPVSASPVLIAMTGVTPDAKAADLPEAANLRDVALITPQAGSERTSGVSGGEGPDARGVPIDLSVGKLDTDYRWITPEGIAVTCEGQLDNSDKTGGCEYFWARASSAVYDNLEWTRCSIAPGIQVKVTLPQPRTLSGIAITGTYRDEIYSNDFSPSILDYMVEATADGTNWYPVTLEKVTGYIPEEEGAKYHALGDKPIQAVRIHVWRNMATSKYYERGIAYLQLFEKK